MDPNIFQKFSDNLKKVLILAEKIAKDSGKKMDSEEMLLALSTIKGTISADILANFEITPERLQVITKIVASNSAKKRNNGVSKIAKEIIQIAGERGIPVRYKTGSELTSLFPETNHQGIVALAENFIYSDLDNIINSSRQENGFLLLIALDHITDEGNFGAIIRTAAFFGVHGLIIPKDRSAKVTSRVFKRSSGACVYIQIVRVVNLLGPLIF